MRAAFLFFLSVSSFCLFISVNCHGQGKWINVFNGKDLTNWYQLGGKASYEIKDGAVVGVSRLGEPNSFLVTKNTYKDFILEFEFKVDDGLNSGVQFRSEKDAGNKVFGYQMEIDTSPRGWTGGIYDESRRQWLYSGEYNTSARGAFKKQVWNKARIECIGNTLRTWINNVPVAHVVDDVTPEGFIALQVHSIDKDDQQGKTVSWRNIRIQTEKLVPTAVDSIFVLNLLPNVLTEQEKQNGVRLLFDGKTNNGWRGTYKETFPENGWEIKDGALNVLKSAGAESKNGGDIVTTEQYGAFDLQFEFRLTEGANSGVKYFVTEKEGNAGSAIGLEYQVLDDERHPDAKQGVVGNRTLASLYDLIPSIKNPRGLKKIGEWNQGRIIVYPDNRIEHWLNGYKVVEYQRGTPIFYALVARSKYAQWENFGMAPEGRILLQDHGDAVSFRSIKIKTFK
jgi:hypothetical protein